MTTYGGTTDRAAADREAAAAGIEVRPVAGHAGAEIEGVDLAGDLGDDVVSAVRAAVNSDGGSA